jgi:hypothetical protein
MSRINIFVYATLKKPLYRYWSYRELPINWKYNENEYCNENQSLELIEHFYGTENNIKDFKLYLNNYFTKLKDDNVITKFDIRK